MQLHRRRVKAGDVFAGMPFVKRVRLIGFVDYLPCVLVSGMPFVKRVRLAGRREAFRQKSPPYWFFKDGMLKRSGTVALATVP